MGHSTNPYQAPGARADDAARRLDPSYQSLVPLTPSLTLFFWLCALGEAAGVLVELSRTLASWFYLPLRLGPFFVCALLFSRFLYRSNANCRALGLGPLSYSPAAMVWWHFVPLAHLVVPYLAVKQVFSASDSQDEFDDPPQRVFWWWACWAASSISIYATSWVGRWLDLVASAAYIASCLLAVGVVRTLAELQESSARALGVVR